MEQIVQNIYPNSIAVSSTANMVAEDLLRLEEMDIKDLFNIVISKWNYRSIKILLGRYENFNQVKKVINALAGFWYEAVYYERTNPKMFDSYGNCVWSTSEGMIKHLTSIFKDLIEARKAIVLEQDLFSIKPSLQPIVCNTGNSYYDIVKKQTLRPREVFDDFNVRELMPKLNCLTDEAYDNFLLKFVSSPFPCSVALMHEVGIKDLFIREHIESRDGTRSITMGKFVTEAYGGFTTNTFNQEFATLCNEKKACEGKHSAFKYKNEARLFYDSLEKVRTDNIQ